MISMMFFDKQTYMISNRLFGISKLNQFNKALLNKILDISVMAIEIALKKNIIDSSIVTKNMMLIK